MKTDDTAFVRGILAEAASPHVAAESFVLDVARAGLELSRLQADTLLALRYDAVVQVHGLASVVEDMLEELEPLAAALRFFGCETHAAEVDEVRKALASMPGQDSESVDAFVRDRDDLDDVTLRLNAGGEDVRERVLARLKALQQ